MNLCFGRARLWVSLSLINGSPGMSTPFWLTINNQYYSTVMRLLPGILQDRCLPLPLDLLIDAVVWIKKMALKIRPRLVVCSISNDTPGT